MHSPCLLFAVVRRLVAWERRWRRLAAWTIGIVAVGPLGWAQAQIQGISAIPASSQIVAAQGGAASGPASRFAPGVLTTIEPVIDRDDALSIHDVVEIRAQDDLKWDPQNLPQSRTLYEKAKEAAFPQDIWCLELTFKPLRMIQVGIPQADGSIRQRLIWYLVYRVRNTGAGARPQIAPDGSFTTQEAPTESIRFIPQFVLASQDRDAQGEVIRKSYLDRVLPAALGPIARREFGGKKLLHSVEMVSQEFQVEEGRGQEGAWGVATWEGIDPEIDFFSVFVGGLTNAYRWDDPAGAFKAGDPPGTGRTFERRVLQLNFWRPGDRYGQDEREVRFGAAPGKGSLYEGGEGVAHRWVYR